MTALETGGDWRTPQGCCTSNTRLMTWSPWPCELSIRFPLQTRQQPTAQWREFQQCEIQGNTTDCTYFKRNYCETWGQCCKRTERSKLLYEVDPTKTFKWQNYARLLPKEVMFLLYFPPDSRAKTRKGPFTRQLFDQLLKCGGWIEPCVWQGVGLNQLKVGVRGRDLL